MTKSKSEKSKSEFGKGLTYCLGLFLAHESHLRLYRDEIRDKTNSNIWPMVWFNGASDHLYEMEIPDTLPKSLQKRLLKFKRKVLNYGHGEGLMGTLSMSEGDINDCIQEAKNLLIKVDKWMGIKAVKGDYE